MLFRVITRVAITLILSATVATGHGGGIDSNGGHYDRKKGEYHKHNSGGSSNSSSTKSSSLGSPSSSSGSESYSAHSSNSSSTSATSDFAIGSRDQRINEYFRGGNENVGALSCNQVKHDRDVDQSAKNHVKNRDGNKCVICSSTVKLEVDHRRALMNGGDNSLSNLFTLCDDCHTEKTRM